VKTPRREAQEIKGLTSLARAMAEVEARFSKANLIDEIDDEANEGEEFKNLVQPAGVIAYCTHHSATGRTHVNLD
jgi:hypothetical protein